MKRKDILRIIITIDAASIAIALAVTGHPYLCTFIALVSLDCIFYRISYIA